MKRLLVAPIVLAIVAMAGVARAEDPSGTWKWTAMMGNNTREVTLKLKLDGDKLTGTINTGNRDVEISDGTYKDGDVAFSVVRERNGSRFSLGTDHPSRTAGSAARSAARLSVYWVEISARSSSPYSRSASSTRNS